MNALDLGQFFGIIHESVANHFDLCTFSGTSLLATRIFKLTKPEAIAEEFVTAMKSWGNPFFANAPLDKHKAFLVSSKLSLQTHGQNGKQ